MNCRTWTRIIALALFAALALPLQMEAQNAAKQHHPHQYHHYQLVAPGTFGGPGNGLQNPGLPRAGVLNNRGTLAGWGLTPPVDPYCGFGGSCNAGDALQFQDGVTTDLGKLAGGIDSQVNWISQNGLMTGVADNGQLDPLSGGTLPQIHGAFWKNGRLTDMGTLPEGGYISFPTAVNNRGEVVGNAQNTVPDPTPIVPFDGTQTRAFYWKDGVMQDLGTLGAGTDAAAARINERGQVVGWSYTNSVPSPFCSGLGFALTTGTFIWDKKNGMQDIGTLGGTCTVAWDLNNRGRVVGESSQLGDPTNVAFVWDRETGITELTTAGYGGAFAVNDAGEIAGYGQAPDGQTSAILWRKTGGTWHTTYLGRLHSGDCAEGVSINASGQVVGVSGPNGCSTTLPFLWEDGGPMVDLNKLVPANSGTQLTEAVQINNRGEIAAQGPDASGNNHAVLLIPCDENHPGVEGCDYSMVDAETLQQSAAPATHHPAAGIPRNRMHAGMLNRFFSRSAQQTPFSATVPAPTAEQTFPANTAGVDVEGEQLLGPLAGRYKGYCGVYSGKLTGYCTAYSYYSCLAKTSTACPSGKTATKPGYFHCSNTGSRYVDLARGCGFN